MPDRMVLIGLGNPDAAYAGTRHNLGRDVLRAFEAAGGTPVGAIFFYPPALMNESGPAAAAFLRYHQLTWENVLVAHDDLELPLGDVRLETGGSARGHNGVRSVQAALDTQDFHRLRLGVGRPPEGMPARDFVLQKFNEDEQEAIADLTKQAHEELAEFLSRA